MVMSQKIGRVGPLRFLACGEGREPWIPTRAWAVSRASAAPDDMDAWDLALDEPPAGADALPLHDLKRWVLFGNRDARWIEVRGSSRGFTAARKVVREDALRRYLAAVHRTLPAAYRDSRTSLLIPAIADGTRRKRYLEAIREEFPDARVLPEPEMVVEYFRLVQRSLQLDRSRNNYILVIDIGASTCNITVIISNRGGEVSRTSTGVQRAGRLRAIHGDSGEFAGQWVDEWLAERLKIDLDELSTSNRLEVLASIERSKIQVSRSGAAVTFEVGPLERSFSLSAEDLENASIEIISRLGPLLEGIFDRLWTKIVGTERAQSLSAEDRRERGVDGPESALKLIDFVLLAGGTTRLRSFRDYLEAELGSSARFLEVGESFPIAAAVGALAHVLHEKYKPPRIRASAARPLDEDALEGALDTDLLFAWKRAVRGREERLVVLERGDPLVYQGGSREGVATINAESGEEVLARLVPDVKPMRAGLRPTQIRLKSRQPTMGVRVDEDRRVIMTSEEVERIQNVRLDLGRYDVLEGQPRQRYAGEIRPHSLAFDSAEEVVIDFGMSKTVVVAPDVGLLQSRDLDGPVEFVVAPAETPRTSLPRSDEDPGEGGAPELEESARGEDPGRAEETVVAGDQQILPQTTTSGDGLIRRSNEHFADAIAEFLEWARESEIDVPAGDLVYALLGLAVRPLVLLAGAPGCGKSTLARLIGRFLNRTPTMSFHEVAVQAHWVDDRRLFDEEGALLKRLLDAREESHLVLFDEFNLARPEFYLTRFFNAIDPSSTKELALAPTLAIGTLNVDETSRPPSPKVLDRSFLVEVEQVTHDHDVRGASPALDVFPWRGIGVLPDYGARAELQDVAQIQRLVEIIEDVVRSEGLREDFLPSRRTIADVRGVIGYFRAIPSLETLITLDDIADRLISGKILIRIAGALEQTQPLLDVLSEYVKGLPSDCFRRTRRRVRLAERQASLGFIHPWQ
ncbi:MAG: AAA family ATPase [Myxococcales bacterium]|nr:AAA family ATPase [Myxococcales bacterium]